AERNHLTEDFLRRFFGDAAGEGAGAEFIPKPRDQVMRPAAAHRAAQGLGLSRRKSRERLADLQYLILVENDAECFAEAFTQQRMIDGRLVRLAGGVRAALLFAPAHVRVHRAADDRPGPHDRDLDGEVLEVAWPAAANHLDLRAALDLKQSDGVTGADTIVDRRIFEIDAGEIGWCSGPSRNQLNTFFDE